MPSYTIASFIAHMLGRPGKARLFSPYARRSMELVHRIHRETEYRPVAARLGYMPVEIHGRRFALRVEDGRRFFLWPEADTRMAEARVAAVAPTSASVEPAPVAAVPASDPDPENQGMPVRPPALEPGKV